MNRILTDSVKATVLDNVPEVIVDLVRDLQKGDSRAEKLLREYSELLTCVLQDTVGQPMSDGTEEGLLYFGFLD